MSGEPVVRVEGVSKKFSRSLKKSIRYGVADIARDLVGLPAAAGRLRPSEFWALDEVSLEVRRGECLGLIGPNGAGKSTLLKMLNGIIMPDKGWIEIHGRSGALIELGAGFHPLLTGRENIYINGSILGLSKREINAQFDSIVAFSELEDFLDTPVKFYSSGMFVRLGFAVAAHLHPDILVIDEVLAVGDVAFQAKCFNKLGDLRHQDMTVILVSHNMHRIAGFCDRAVYLKSGGVRCLGETAKAIAAYTSDTIKDGPADQDGADMAGVYGSGRVKITGLKFISDRGQDVSRVRSGEPVTVRVFYRAEQEVENPVLDLAMWDSAPGNMFQATNRDYGVELGKLSGNGHIDVAFKSLNVNNQIIDFFVALWDSKHTELFDWKRHIKLQVEGDPMSSGRMLFDCEWKNEPGRRGPAGVEGGALG
jgi:lipopolysaccharide transport system ATP-binding protein